MTIISSISERTLYISKTSLYCTPILICYIAIFFFIADKSSESGTVNEKRREDFSSTHQETGIAKHQLRDKRKQESHAVFRYATGYNNSAIHKVCIGNTDERHVSSIRLSLYKIGDFVS